MSFSAKLIVSLAMGTALLGQNVLAQDQAKNWAQGETPHMAVLAAARNLAGEDGPELQIPRQAFSGFPEPQNQVHFRARSVNSDLHERRISVEVEAINRSRVLARRTFLFPWRTSEMVVVPKRTIKKGEMIRSEDLQIKKIELGAEAEEYALSIDQLLGHIAKRRLDKNHPVRKRQLSRPTVVKRGEPVVVQRRIGGMKLTMKGEAVQDGTIGQYVKIINPSSKRILTGKVIDHGVVEVF